MFDFLKPKHKDVWLCRHCGYATAKFDSVTCKYCKTELQREKLNLEEIGREEIDWTLYVWSTYIQGHPEHEEAYYAREAVIDKEKQQKLIAWKTQELMKNTPHCPKCGSTAVVIGTRGYSVVTGFIGSGDTMNRCGNCGHKWKPKG